MKRGLVRILIISLCIVLILCVTVGIMIRAYLGKIDRFDSDNLVETKEFDDEVSTIHTGEAGETNDITDDSNVINILLVGQTTKEKDTKAACEAILLCTINKMEKKIVLTSLHSDTWVKTSDGHESTLGQIGKIGGIGLLNSTLEQVFGIKPDHSIVVNMSGFAQLIDELGGVSVDLLQGEADCMNAFSDNKWSLEAGTNKLTGEQAFHYSRMTQSDTDYGRNDRQKRILLAAVNRLNSAELADIKDIALDIAQMVSTDMTDQQIVSLATEFAPMLKELQIAQHSIPIESQYTLVYKENVEVLVMNETQLEKNKKLLAEITGN